MDTYYFNVFRSRYSSELEITLWKDNCLQWITMLLLCISGQGLPCHSVKVVFSKGQANTTKNTGPDTVRAHWESQAKNLQNHADSWLLPHGKGSLGQELDAPKGWSIRGTHLQSLDTFREKLDMEKRMPEHQIQSQWWQTSGTCVTAGCWYPWKL